MKKFSRTLAVLFAAVTMVLPGTVQAAPVVEEVVIPVERLAGKGRMETAVKVSKLAYKEGADAVVLAGYNGEVDALTGTLLANAKKAPLLVTEKGRLSSVTKNEIIRLGAKTVYILGGDGVVSDQVVSDLEVLNNVKVERVSGTNRYGTAKAVATAAEGKTTHVFLALGEDKVLADALSVGPVSAMKDMPVLLTAKDSIPQATKEALETLGVTDITIVGGSNAVSTDVEKELAKSYKLDRVSGRLREQTAEAIATRYFPSPKKVIIANDGRVSYADALVGGYLGALMEAPILLTQTNVFPETTKDYMEINTDQAYILGGEGVVSRAVETAVGKVVAIENKDVLEVKESIKLSRNYKTVNVTKDEVVVDLNGKTVETLTVTSNKTTIKNGTVINIVVGKDVTDVIFDDIIDDGDGTHEFEGGGSQSIVLKGKTQLKSNINISSATPIQIRAENLDAGKGMTGKVTVNTEAAVTIAAPVKELEVKKENKAIKINAEVGKVSALANATISVGKDIKMPTLEKAKGVTATAKDSAGKEEVFEENEKLEPTTPVTPPSGGGAVTPPASTEVTEVTVTGEAVVGEILTAKRTPANADGTYQWMKADSADGEYAVIADATASTYEIKNGDKFIKVKFTATGNYTGVPVSEVIEIAEAPVGLNLISVDKAEANGKYNFTVKAEGDDLGRLHVLLHDGSLGPKYEDIDGTTGKIEYLVLNASEDGVEVYGDEASKAKVTSFGVEASYVEATQTWTVIINGETLQHVLGESIDLENIELLFYVSNQANRKDRSENIIASHLSITRKPKNG